jgi:hypothetical protein
VGLVEVVLVNGGIIAAAPSGAHCTTGSAVTTGACTGACGRYTGWRRATAFVVFPASGTIFVVRVLLHMYHAQSFCLLHVRTSVLRRQTPPFLTWNTELNMM